MLEGFSWNMTGYTQKYGFKQPDSGMTRQEAERVFQLEPDPPARDSLNDYIVSVISEKNLDFFSFFLHHYERLLNARVYNFLRSDGNFQYDPERFLDIKLSCVEAMLQKLPDYDPGRGAAFTTYIYPFVEDAMLRHRMREEAWSISSLDTYKKLRIIAWLYHNTRDAAQEFAEKQGCELALAEEYLKTARGIRSRKPLYVTSQDEDSEETGEDVTRDDSWNYADILWNGMQVAAIQYAFEKLDLRERTLLEKRNAICMTCGRVSPWRGRPTFEELAVMFEGSTASGAERAYRKAVERLTLLLVEDGVLHAVRLRRVSQKRAKKKIAAAVYEYLADSDGEWGEIAFDFTAGTAEITRLADGDTVRSNIFAKQTIKHLLNCENDKLPKETLVAFYKPDSGMVRPRPPAMSQKTAHTLRLEQGAVTRAGKKITAAVYRYLADSDGEWGEIAFDFTTGTAEIIRLADWDTMRSNIYANRAIRCIQSCGQGSLPLETELSF